MKNPFLPLILVALVVATVVSALTVYLLVPSPAVAGSGSAVVPSEMAELTRAMERIEARQAEFSARIDELGRAQRPDGGRTAVGELDAAVARYFEQRGEGLSAEDASLAEVQDQGSTKESAARRVEAAFQELLSGELSAEARLELWTEIQEQGLTDELVAAFEDRAEREPNDPDVRVDLGQAYLQKVFEAGSGPMAGVWAMKADGAFDAALALDENHWDARFNKAISLSFWPPALGMQGKAVAQFETLLAKQGQVAQEPKHAQTYLYLGNMYQQLGQGAKALETWQQGLALYPESAELSGQIDVSLEE